MKKYGKSKQTGRFNLSGGLEIIGELNLKGRSTTLNLHSDKYFDVLEEKDILGEFLDRSKVSLINCIRQKSTRRSDDYYHAELFPHFVIFGPTHIKSDDQIIHQFSFTIDDASTVFYDYDAFGIVLNSRPHMERIAEEHNGRRPLKIGEDPHIFYFNGKFEIFSVKTIVGKVSASHRISYKFPGPNGINLKNKIKFNVELSSPKKIEEVTVFIHDFLRFLEVVAGRPQNISDLQFLLPARDDRPVILDVYWCMPPRRSTKSESPAPHPAGVLMQEIFKPGEFGNVLKNWIERNETWRNARIRFSTAFAFQREYCIDRLVGAANMFDILPTSAYPNSVSLGSELIHARDEARGLFNSLENSPERNSILNALGRIGKLTLKNKVRARAAVIIDTYGERFSELELVLYQAVDCRNYYVHGTQGKFDYATNHAQVSFFTNTLEFVFAAADFIECGWDIVAWEKQGPMHAHPFAQYLETYEWELEQLKSLLTTKKTLPFNDR